MVGEACYTRIMAVTGFQYNYDDIGLKNEDIKESSVIDFVFKYVMKMVN